MRGLPSDEIPELVEPFSVQDTVVQGLGEVEVIGGGWARFVFYCVRHGQREVVLRVVMPIDTIPMAREVTDAALAGETERVRAVAN